MVCLSAVVGSGTACVFAGNVSDPEDGAPAARDLLVACVPGRGDSVDLSD